ncbi:PREDICTED: PHD finger protein At1g33420-like [Fragaria vesca subsp. vesca]|uniref:PHD finger protein At1g33420-like n=1 Tax=Fragaria vesca subsp. vesca TaxID=101020 RepID=UPI0002C34F7C|nr:PREDICTED: PHD finger protein At1g33420-like [Fragaria vesca subsp. vesca]
MVVNERPQKRMKRRITADLNDFFTFPSSSAGATGPFRTVVREFLSNHALVPPPSSLFPHLMTWQILFRVGDAADQLPATAASADGPDSPVVCLDIVEEDVARSRNVYCDQCRVVGWSGHPVCGKRYHFIIKADGNSIGGYHKPCMCCGDVVHIYESKCKSCNLDASTDDVEDWVYSQLENTTHLLHGVVHSNGFGHLLRVNGREGGSRMLSGCHIMDFWDRLCKVLGVRMVSVMDVSKKYGLEYRLLHAIIRGHPWYGDWGYEFATGSFALTLDAYNLAVEKLSTLPLSTFLAQRRFPSCIRDIILRYQSLSEHELLNIRDLFSFLIKLIHDAPKCSSRGDDAMSKKRRASGVLYSWTKSDVECVEEAMVKVLRAVTGPNWVNQRNLRKAIYKGQPPDLLDYSLNELGGKIVAEGIFVNSRRNADGDFEYRLEAGSASDDSSTSRSLSEENLVLDIRFLYESMLHPQTMMKDVPQETRDLAVSCAEKLLDCKQFVKDYKPERMSTKDPSLTCVLCRVEFTDESEEYSTLDPPPELIVLTNATVSDLKVAASKAFQDVYLVLKRFQAEELVDYGGVDESTQVKKLLGSGEYVRVRGRCNAKSGWSKFSMERGMERWTVECSCGAKDDDGERMMACDLCGVWRHTRCSGIPDSDSVPASFVCQGCKNSVPVTQNAGPCKDEVVAKVESCSFGNNLIGPPDVR